MNLITMNPMLIAVIFVVAMALPAYFAVKFAARSHKQPALAYEPVRRHFTRSTEGSVVVPVRAEAVEEATAKPKLSARAAKRQPVEFAEGEVNAVIERLILSVPVQGLKRLS
ncbi:MAG TPA: hypothetical protein VL986_02250 [Terracidiphilus sp.]|nr:hypothetical protein [Terracidiphilus sp.]